MDGGLGLESCVEHFVRTRTTGEVLQVGNVLAFVCSDRDAGLTDRIRLASDHTARLNQLTCYQVARKSCPVA